jgi:hypothetical protein
MSHWYDNIRAETQAHAAKVQSDYEDCIRKSSYAFRDELNDKHSETSKAIRKSSEEGKTSVEIPFPRSITDYHECIGNPKLRSANKFVEEVSKIKPSVFSSIGVKNFETEQSRLIISWQVAQVPQYTGKY